MILEKMNFNKTFSEFLNKHEKVILKLLNIIASFKKNKPPNTYQYSNKYPPPRANYKYTDKLFIGCILYIALNNSSWISFIGPIPGKQVHKRFKEYINKNAFKKLFEESVKEYLCTNVTEKTRIISTDTTIITNKNCIELTEINPYLKNKKCIKVSSFVDSKGTPISVSINSCNEHDSKIFNKEFDRIINTKPIKKSINGNCIILADKGYDTKAIRKKIKKSKMKCIIAYNKRNTKDKTKIKELNEVEKKVYKKRVKIEHYFGIIKRYPKINNVYEKTLSSYLNLILLVSSMILIKRTR